MPEMSLPLVLFLVCVGLFTASAAVWDLRLRRIPNKLTLPVFGLGILYQGIFYGPAGLANAAQGFSVGFGLLFVLWLIGGGGGGDVKLMGALSVWLGFRLTILVLIGSTVFVLVGTLGVIVWGMVTRGMVKTQEKYVAVSEGKKGKKPKAETLQQRQQRRVMAYAVPVALATWVVVIYELRTFPFLEQ